MIVRAPRLLLALLLLASCSVYRVETVDTLYFGTEMPDHKSVTMEQWTQFQHDVIEPKLKGFTTWGAIGEWRDDSGRVFREATIVMQVVHNGEANAAIDEIIAAYKKRFAQESVLRVHARAGVAFQ